MRNYNSKTPIKPLTQHSFRKDDRIYPAQQKMKRQCSIGKSDVKPQTKNNQKLQSNQITSIRNFVLPIPNHQNSEMQDRYYIKLQQPFQYTDRHSNQMIYDPFCLWYKQIPPLPLQGKRILLIKKISYVITDWVDDLYPSSLFLTIQGMAGYLNQNSIATNRIANLRLMKIQPIQRNGVDVNDLIYETCGDVQWQIPKSLTYLKFQFQDDQGTNIQMPLPNPIILQLKICRYNHQTSNKTSYEINR